MDNAPTRSKGPKVPSVANGVSDTILDVHLHVGRKVSSICYLLFWYSDLPTIAAVAALYDNKKGYGGRPAAGIL